MRDITIFSCHYAFLVLCTGKEEMKELSKYEEER